MYIISLKDFAQLKPWRMDSILPNEAPRKSMEEELELARINICRQPRIVCQAILLSVAEFTVCSTFDEVVKVYTTYIHDRDAYSTRKGKRIGGDFRYYIVCDPDYYLKR